MFAPRGWGILAVGGMAGAASRRAGCFRFVIGILVASTLTPARAAPPSTQATPAALTVSAAPGACPRAAAVAAAAAQLLPKVRVTAAEGPDGAGAARVEDLGDRYRVVFDGTSREVREPARDCAERARAAAVIIALTLDPPLAAPAPAPAPSPAPAIASHAAPPPPSAWRVMLQIDASLEAVPDVATVTAITGGGAVRAWLGGRHFGVGLGVGVVAPLVLRLETGRAEILRIPCDLDVYGALGRGPWEGVAEIGLTLGAIRMAGQDVTAAAHATRLEVGGRLALNLRYWARAKVAPFLGFEAGVVPSPHELLVTSVGVAGHTPRAWLGVHFGVVGRIR
jgi:hypothetical protein